MTPKQYAQDFWDEWLAGEIGGHLERANTRKLVEKYIQKAVDAERKAMPCGHPQACLIMVTDELRAIPFEDVDATHYCAVCEREARLRDAAEELLNLYGPFWDESSVDLKLQRDKLEQLRMAWTDESRRQSHAVSID